MIKCKTDYLYYLDCDRKALGVAYSSLREKIVSSLTPNVIWTFEKRLRKYEYLLNVHDLSFRSIRLLIAKYRYKRMAIKLGFTIAPNCFREGLKIAHYGGIIVNANCKIGKNCSIRPFTVIGNKKDGMNNAIPIIGDNVTIGSNVTIIGDVKIGDNVVIGAGCVVVKDIESNKICIGNPARILGL